MHASDILATFGETHVDLVLSDFAPVLDKSGLLVISVGTLQGTGYVLCDPALMGRKKLSIVETIKKFVGDYTSIKFYDSAVFRGSYILPYTFILFLLGDERTGTHERNFEFI